MNSETAKYTFAVRAFDRRMPKKGSYENIIFHKSVLGFRVVIAASFSGCMDHAESF